MLIIDMRHPYSIENPLGKNYRPSGRVFLRPCKQLSFTVPIIIPMIGIVKPYSEKIYRDFLRR